MKNSPLTILLGAALCVPLPCLTSAAQEIRAQQIQIRVGDFDRGLSKDHSFTPTMNKRQFVRYAEVLDLDEMQLLVAEQMLDQYLQKFQDGADVVRDAMSEVKEEVTATGDWSIYMTEMNPIFEDWGAQREQLESELVERLRSLLGDDQLDRWSLFEREKRRAELLPNARLGGEDIDVILLVGDLKLDDAARAPLAEILEEYAMQIDAALQSRERTIEPLQKEFWESIGDRERAEDMWQEGTHKRAVVRDTNERYVNIVASMIDEESAAELLRTYKKRAFPLAFEDTKADLLFDEVSKLNLTPNQVEQIDLLESGFRGRIEPLRRQMIREIQIEEEQTPGFVSDVIRSEGGKGVMLTAITGFGGEDGDDPLGDLRKDRYHLSKGVAEQVESILTPEQVAHLPRMRTPKSVGDTLRAMQFKL